MRSGDLLYGRHPRSRTAQVQSGVLRRTGQGTGEARGELDRDQGYGRPLQAGGRGAPDQDVARGGRRSDPLPHARHRRRTGGERPARLGRRPGHRRRRRGIHGVPDVAAQLERAGRVAPIHPSRVGPRFEGPHRDQPVLGGGPDPLCTVRVGPAFSVGRPVRSGDARRPVLEPLPAGQGARIGRAVA